MKKLLLLLPAVGMIFTACEAGGGLDEGGNGDLSLNKIATIEEQGANIKATIATLETTKSAVNATIASLNEQQPSVRGNDNGNNGVKDMIAALEDRLAALEQMIANLKEYADGDLSEMQDWAEATFATMEQYNTLASELATLKVLLEGFEGVSTTELSDALAASEQSMKQWVNEQLSGYATIADVEAQIAVLKEGITSELNEQVEKVVATLTALMNDTKQEYEKAIADAIQNQGIINDKIAEDIANINKRIDEELATINKRLDDIEKRLDEIEDKIESLLARIVSVSHIPQYTDGSAVVGSRLLNLDFEIEPKEAIVELVKVWERAVSLKAVYAETGTIEFVNLPIIQLHADEAMGIISVTASCENLSEEFFAGKQEASVSLTISDQNNSIQSNYIRIVPSQIEIDKKLLSFSCNEGSQEVGINANFNYEVSEESDWVSIEKESCGIKVVVAANNFAYERSAEIVISNAKLGEKHIIYVVQEAMSFELELSTMITRTALVNGDIPIVWEPEDKVWCNGIVSNQTIINESFAYVAKFKFDQIITPPYSIVYPAPSPEIKAIKEGCCPVIFPAIQNYIKNTFDTGSFPMYQYTTTTHDSLDYLSGILVFAIKGNGETLSHITLSAETGCLSGIFDLDCQNGEITPQEGKVSSQIRYDFGNGLQLSSDATKMYITVPAGNFGAIAVSIYTIDNKCMTAKITTSSKPIRKGEMRKFNELVFSANPTQ